MEGEEFNQRVLTPMTEAKFYMLFQQGADLGMLLRMTGSEFQLQADAGPRVVWNRPGRGADYREFRRRVLHLVALYQSHQLFVEPVFIQQTVAMDGKNADDARLVIDALDRGYRWSEDGPSRGVLSRRLGGRIIISNYDPSSLTPEELRGIYFKTNSLPDSEIFVDIRQGLPGGDYPMRGTIRLRGFLAVLGFLARSLDQEIEYPVEKDPRTGPVKFNPSSTLQVRETDDKPANAAFTAKYEGKIYSIPNSKDQAGIWNMEAFRLLSQLYELSVHPSEFTRAAPAITISK